MTFRLRPSSSGPLDLSPGEIQMHLALADLLDRTVNPRKWRWTHIPLGGKRETKTGALLKRMGVKPGWPDFLFIAWTGHIYFLELKSRKGALEPEQLAFRSTMRAWNIEHQVARSIDDAIAILGRWGVVPVKVEAA